MDGSVDADFGGADEQGRAALAPGKDRKWPKMIFFKWEGMKSMGKRIIVPGSEEHVPDGGEENPFPNRSVAGHFTAEGS